MQILATTLIAFGGLFCFAKLVDALSKFIEQKSFIRLFRCLERLCLGLGLSLIPATRRFAWIAIPLDYGTLVLLFALPKLFYEAWTICRFNLLKEYSGNCGNKKAKLHFFRNDIFLIKLQIQRPTGETGNNRTWQNWKMASRKFFFET